MKVMLRSFPYVLACLCLFLMQDASGRQKLTSEEKAAFAAREDSLRVLAYHILYGKKDPERSEACLQFSTLLQTTLERDKSFLYPFDSLSSIARLTAPDRTFRIFNWNMPLDDGTFRYFGMVQTYDKKKKSSMLFSLTDGSAEISDPESKLLGADNWYGALYYSIIPEQKKRSTYYTLIGWDGNNPQTTKKVIDVIYFDKGKLRFGAPIFMIPKARPYRLIYEYSSQAIMSIRYYPEPHRIIMDHLAPSKPQLEGQFIYYGPDLTYDALELKEGKWIYIPNVNITNPSNNTISEQAPSQEERQQLEQGVQKGLFKKKEE
ncbi:MAG: hypothetical protein KDD36_06605 [Flavobacteriales bacterium]|nr:hypothetical protein [Flavobacteriales bacterium]